MTDNLLESIANSIGELDVPQWKDDFAAGGGEDGVITKRLEAQDETARGLGLRAEPSAIVNGPGGTRTLQDSPDPRPARAQRSRPSPEIIRGSRGVAQPGSAHRSGR